VFLSVGSRIYVTVFHRNLIAEKGFFHNESCPDPMGCLAMQPSIVSVAALDEYNLTSLYGISQSVILFVRVAGAIALSSALRTSSWLLVCHRLGNGS